MMVVAEARFTVVVERTDRERKQGIADEGFRTVREHYRREFGSLDRIKVRIVRATADTLTFDVHVDYRKDGA